MEFGNRALRFLDSLELNKPKAFRALRLPVRDDFRVLNNAYSVEQLNEITLGGVKGQVAHVNPGSRHFDRLGLANPGFGFARFALALRFFCAGIRRWCARRAGLADDWCFPPGGWR